MTDSVSATRAENKTLLREPQSGSSRFLSMGVLALPRAYLAFRERVPLALRLRLRLRLRVREALTLGAMGGLYVHCSPDTTLRP